MQRDINRTFGEIHGSKEALIDNIEHILDVALVKANEDEPLTLRFVTPLSLSTNWCANVDWPIAKDSQDYRLTAPEEHTPGLDYISVSYCWKHTQSPEGHQIPNYQIWDGSVSRPIKCPPLVFQRAFQFARRHHCPYIWIDQECIDQDDSTDIERHLQIMHRVYRESKRTVAVLSWDIPDLYSLYALVRVIYVPDSLQEHDYEQVATVALKRFLWITCDPWFTRTWAFQEKQCAGSLQLLVPIDPKLDIPEVLYPFAVGNDLCLDIRASTSRIMQILHGDSSMKLAEYWQANSSWSFETPLTHLSFRLNKASQFISPKTHDLLQLREHLTLLNALCMIESCDNMVVADRVSIFGNISKLPNRLLSNRLNYPIYSYSTCLLALLIANFYPDAKERSKFISRRTWDPQPYSLRSILSGGLSFFLRR